jgi:peroxiredoxin
MTLKLGDIAPDFTTQTTQGEITIFMIGQATVG